jgi:hypothetical protein
MTIRWASGMRRLGFSLMNPIFARVERSTCGFAGFQQDLRRWPACPGPRSRRSACLGLGAPTLPPETARYRSAGVPHNAGSSPCERVGDEQGVGERAFSDGGVRHHAWGVGVRLPPRVKSIRFVLAHLACSDRHARLREALFVAGARWVEAVGDPIGQRHAVGGHWIALPEPFLERAPPALARQCSPVSPSHQRPPWARSVRSALLHATLDARSQGLGLF